MNETNVIAEGPSERRFLFFGWNCIMKTLQKINRMKLSEKLKTNESEKSVEKSETSLDKLMFVSNAQIQLHEMRNPKE